MMISTADGSDSQGEMTSEFEFMTPSQLFGPRPLWFWNGDLSSDEIRKQVQSIAEAGYAGFGIVPAYGMSVASIANEAAPEKHAAAPSVFMSPAYLDAYAVAVQTAADLGLRVCLYDEFWFPSGWAAGRVAREYPEALSKRIDQHAIELAGPTRYSKRVPDGKLMAAVAMNVETRERVSLQESIHEGWLTWAVPAGQWRILFYVCVTDGAKGLIDYLDPNAVDAFLSLTYDKYYGKFPEHFGTTVDLGFYDEPTFHWVEGGRAWTPDFNERFVERYGSDPALLYPALWLDIGPETGSARCALFDLRTELFATSYVKRMNDWCTSKGIQLTGHVDQEEIANPVGLCGDLMKVFKHQDIPAFDQIFKYGRARKVAKVVTSAAINFDRQLVACECYGATDGLEEGNARELYREAIDLFACGMNLLMPHAIWYEPATMEFPPNVSLADPDFGPHITGFNKWAARIQNILQRGTPVADIGVLYPIETLMSTYRFDAGGDPYLGGMPPSGDDLARDYLDVGDALVTGVLRDFTYVHPDVLNTQCVVDKNEAGETVLRLAHESGTRPQEFRAFILPGLTAISPDTLQLLKAFHDAGGLLIATRRLPERAVFTNDLGDRGSQPVTSSVQDSSALGTERSAPDRRGSADTGRFDSNKETSSAQPTTLRDRAVAESHRVKQVVDELFGARGRGEFILTSDARSIRSILEKRLPDCDVLIAVTMDESGDHPGDVSRHKSSTNSSAVSSGVLTESSGAGRANADARERTNSDSPLGHVSYLHKKIGGADVYFFGNSMDRGVTLAVKLRGTHRVRLFDPCLGEMREVPFYTEGNGTQMVLCFELKLGPVEALVAVSG